MEVHRPTQLLEELKRIGQPVDVIEDWKDGIGSILVRTSTGSHYVLDVHSDGEQDYCLVTRISERPIPGDSDPMIECRSDVVSPIQVGEEMAYLPLDVDPTEYGMHPDHQMVIHTMTIEEIHIIAAGI